MTETAQTATGRLAERIGDELFEAHRGVLHAEEGRLIMFGNDGYQQDERTRRQVELLRQRLATAGYTEEGFGADTGENYTWVLVVAPPGQASSCRPIPTETDPAIHAEEVLWSAWGEAWGVPASEVASHPQRWIARNAVAAHEAVG